MRGGTNDHAFVANTAQKPTMIARMPDTLEPPSEPIVLERLRTEATLWINAVHLQAARIGRRHAEQYPEPDEITAVEVDLHFFLVALVRLQRCVSRVGLNIPVLFKSLDRLVSTFDSQVPSLRKLRNVSEHIDEYNLDEGHDSSVSRREVQTWAMGTSEDGGLIWHWLGEAFDVRRAHEAATVFYREFLSECDAHIARSRTGEISHG